MNDGTLTIDCQRIGGNGRAKVTVRLGDEILALDELNLSKASARQRFREKVCTDRPGIDAVQVDAELLRIAGELTREPEKVGGADLPELDTSHIVRPELFHTADVSGTTVPTVTLAGREPVGRWLLCLRWHADGRRESRELEPSIALPGDARLWPHPVPGDPTPNMRPGWTARGRRAWLSGARAPDPLNVFRAVCERFAHYLDFAPDAAPGDTATLALWTLFTYTFSAWSAVPYLSIGGPLGSGKSRVFEILQAMVFRALQSSNMTAPCLFRTLHEHGGTLLLDEAERLRDGTPDAGELRSILLSGYKAGSPARRLEKVGDGFQQVSFDVFGPKALAGIATLPEALASRCIRLTMFRSGPDSIKPRRRVNEDPAAWAMLRDDLHALALEHGPTWLRLAGRSDVCPPMSGRNYELWQPIFALAAWLQECGADGLLEMMQDHAERIIADGRDDAMPDTDETLLELLAEYVRYGKPMPTCAELLRAAKSHDEATFGKGWAPKRVSNVLKRYGLRTRPPSGSRRVIDASESDLVRIQRHYGLDLGFSIVGIVASVAS